MSGENVMIKLFFVLVLIWLFALPLQAQVINNLVCQGIYNGVKARIQGKRASTPYAFGSEYVKFIGIINAGGYDGQMTYEGSSATVGFPGNLYSGKYAVHISVLDNTGGRMLIYSGRISLGAPTILGEFSCQWS